MKERPAGTNAEEHVDYLVSSVRLMLWFARKWALEHPDEDITETLQKRVDIYRRTGFNADFLDGQQEGTAGYQEWIKTIGTFKEFHERTKADATSERFERLCVEQLEAGIRSRVGRDLEDIASYRDLAKYQCGSLRFNLAVNADNPQRIGFHIANACYPCSIFDDPLYMPGCLLSLMGQCEARFGVTEVGTGTWLNSHPKWLELFPPVWTERLSPPPEDIRGHYGFWGQFITARKTFNHKLAKKFRETGTLPYGNRSSWCAISELRAHLLKKIARNT